MEKIRAVDARLLLENGYVMLQGYDATRSEELQNCFAECAEKLNGALSAFRFEHEKRPDGECDPDDGFLDWVSGGGPQKDQKYVFHYRPDLLKKMLEAGFVPGGKPLLDRLLDLSHDVYLYHRYIALELLEAFDELNAVPVSFRRALIVALDDPIPTARSVLRLLHYPPRSGTKKAKVHYDRSFLTLHAGDTGGYLFAVYPGGRREVISPERGEVLAFWGCKPRRLVATYGDRSFEPLAHGAFGHTHEVRQAVVSFWHNNHILWDADPVPEEFLVKEEIIA